MRTHEITQAHRPGTWRITRALHSGIREDIVIAVAGPMTGAEPALGRQMKNGAEMCGAADQRFQRRARQEAPARPPGRCLRSETGAVARGENRQQEDPVRCRSLLLVVIDPGFGSLCREQRPADHATNPTFTERKRWNVARVCGRDDQQGQVAGDYIAKNFKGKNIAILNDKPTYGKGLADETKKALNRAGMSEKLYESYTKGDKDFNAIVSRLKAENIDRVYVGGCHQEAGLILRGMRDKGLETILMAGDAFADKEYASITGPAGAGTLSIFGSDPRKTPGSFDDLEIEDVMQIG